jgi:hypothetical protein
LRSRLSLLTLGSLACALLALAPASHAGTEVSYWVWNRSSALSADELGALKAQGVTELYWHVGELDDRAGEWRWRKAPIALPASELRIVPVIRIDPRTREPFSPAATEALVGNSASWCNRAAGRKSRSTAIRQIVCSDPTRGLSARSPARAATYGDGAGRLEQDAALGVLAAERR